MPAAPRRCGLFTQSLPPVALSAARARAGQFTLSLPPVALYALDYFLAAQLFLSSSANDYNSLTR